MLRRLIPLFAALALVAGCSAAPEKGPVVLAASSLQEAITEIADAWARQGHPRPVLSFAGSSALARQVVNGAPADIFVSADEEWMDHLDEAGLLRVGSRAELVGNALVLICPANRRRGEFSLDRARWVAEIAGKRVALADPDTVPAGRYARAALDHLDLWDVTADHVVRAENVRAALALVESGEAEFGIVYATDARVSRKTYVLAQFPQGSHPPIRYPAALLETSKQPDAEAFLAFLSGAEGKAIFAARGFEPLP